MFQRGEDGVFRSGFQQFRLIGNAVELGEQAFLGAQGGECHVVTFHCQHDFGGVNHRRAVRAVAEPFLIGVRSFLLVRGKHIDVQ